MTGSVDVDLGRRYYDNASVVAAFDASALRSTSARAASPSVVASAGSAVLDSRSVTAPIVTCTDPHEHCSTSMYSLAASSFREHPAPSIVDIENRFQ
jgi:hypothetical protein